MIAAVEYAGYKNKWFTEENSWRALEAIKDRFLNKEALENWMSNYAVDQAVAKKTVGLILAGNIPLVGFHDLLCVFISGHRAMVKFSDKDQVLTTFLLDELVRQFPEYKGDFKIVDRLKDFDAVISTGSNNSARYFESYFGKYPHIIRRNRNAVAVLDGSETEEELRKLGDDVFDYYGLGCRNVSKIYVPQNYDLNKLLEVLHERNSIILHSKYKNNFDYNIALFMLNRDLYLNNGSLILKEDKRLASRIACLHYEYYEDISQLQSLLNEQSEQIQCISTKVSNLGTATVDLGKTQSPGLMDYADEVDTMQFLTSLS